MNTLAECYRLGMDLSPIVSYLKGKAEGTPDPQPLPRSPFGVHEGCLSWLEGVSGWLVDTVHVWHVDDLDYRHVEQAGHRVICRLNNGYGSDGTIPHPARYKEFAYRVGYVVGRSHSCHIWIIGNEPNHPNEWPDGQKILPSWYAACYQACRQMIHLQPDHERDVVLLAPVAPWAASVAYEGNNRGGFGDWVTYLQDMATTAVDTGGFEGFALHTYTRHHDGREVWSEARMGPPFPDRYSNFQCYRDFMTGMLPYRGKPVFITEFCPVESGWQNVNNGLVRAAYQELRAFNTKGWPIRSLVLYRGEPHDRWYFGNKPQVREDLRQAIREWKVGQ